VTPRSAGLTEVETVAALLSGVGSISVVVCGLTAAVLVRMTLVVG
jgi:hypothetical protein